MRYVLSRFARFFNKQIGEQQVRRGMEEWECALGSNSVEPEKDARLSQLSGGVPLIRLKSANVGNHDYNHPVALLESATFGHERNLNVDSKSLFDDIENRSLASGATRDIFRAKQLLDPFGANYIEGPFPEVANKLERRDFARVKPDIQHKELPPYAYGNMLLPRVNKTPSPYR